MASAVPAGVWLIVEMIPRDKLRVPGEFALQENAMKYAMLTIAALCGLQLLFANAGDSPIRLAVDLTDGSRVIGTSHNESIGIQSEIGKLRITLKLVDQVRWKPDREHVVLEFSNGDRLTGAVLTEVVHLNTLFGDASPLDHTTIFLGSNLGDGSSHSVKDLPVLLCGGGFRHGQHLAFDPRDPQPFCNLYVSMLQRLGIPADKFSTSTGPLTGLEMAGYVVAQDCLSE